MTPRLYKDFLLTFLLALKSEMEILWDGQLVFKEENEQCASSDGMLRTYLGPLD